jgi:hypothetical protein
MLQEEFGIFKKYDDFTNKYSHELGKRKNKIN